MATVDITGLLTDTHLVSEGKYSSNRYTPCLRG